MMKKTGPGILTWSKLRSGEGWSVPQFYARLITYTLQFWSIYTLDVYSSIVWGGVIRCRESQSRVLYPSELDDEVFSPTGIRNGPSSPITRQDSAFSKPAITDTGSWLHGWNFTTELYRILEHAMDEFHRRRPQNIGPFSPSDLFHRSAPPQSVILDKIILMHQNLPAIFKETRGVVGELTADRYSFQAANIAATLQASTAFFQRGVFPDRISWHAWSCLQQKMPQLNRNAPSHENSLMISPKSQSSS